MWIENLNRLHCERELRFNDLSATPIEKIRELTFRYTLDKDAAHSEAMKHYKARLLAAADRKRD